MHRIILIATCSTVAGYLLLAPDVHPAAYDGYLKMPISTTSIYSR